MEDFIGWIGELAMSTLWFNEIMDDILIESLLIFTALQVCCAVGLHGIFAKMNGKKWLAVLPGANIAYLGSLCRVPIAGVVIALCKMGFLLAAEAAVRVYTIPLMDYNIVRYHCGITALLFLAALALRTAAGFFLYRRLILKFGEESWWLIFFLAAPNLTTLFFGLNPNIRE